MGKNAIINLNGQEASLDSEVNNGDKIEINYAVNGKDAAPKVMEYMSEIDEKFIYCNDKIINVEPSANFEDINYVTVLKRADTK